ncbi:MAG: hypothetical protein QM639_14840 [Rhodocyclaceae bacterium]
MKLYSLIGTLSMLLGCACIYLASAHQRWLPRSLPALARGIGAALLALSWGAFALSMLMITATFVWLTGLMLAFIALPYAGALRSIGRGR